MNEAARVLNNFVLHQVRPELAAELKLLIDLNRLGRIRKGTILRIWHVVKFAERCVPGSCIVPRV